MGERRGRPALAAPALRPAILVDRDGVLNDTVPDPHKGGLPESPLRPQDVRLLPGAARALVELRAAGFFLVLVSNQPAAAKGLVTLAELAAVQGRFVDLLAAEGACLDAVRICPHHPAGVVEHLAATCPCRKPAPGLLLAAGLEHDLDLSASWMVGDADTDMAAGRAAGTRTALVEHTGSAHRREGAAADVQGASLSAIAPRLSADGHR